MIRGYVAVVDGNSPSSNTRPDRTVCRKTAVRLISDTEDEDNREFYLSIDRTRYSFKVIGNLRTVDKCNMASGLLCIGFIVPKLDIVISGNPKELEAFVYTLVAVKDPGLLPPKCFDRTHASKLECICQGSLYSEYTCYHTVRSACPLSVYPEKLCSFCCYHVLESYNHDDARKILNTWKIHVQVGGPLSKINSITVNSFPYLSVISASRNNLTEVPEAIGLLPCLKVLILSDNKLGQATNWNCLCSPFVRENLCELDLDGNGLFNFPEPILGLKNLMTLALNNNYLTELPITLRSLKSLSRLYISRNKLVILPGWIYRKELYYALYTSENSFDRTQGVNRSISQLKPNDFETITVPSLFTTASRFIIANRLPFWECNIPATLTQYLDGAYYCRCNSIVFPNTTGHIIHCWIKANVVAVHYDSYADRGGGSLFPISIPCCSYECYKLIESFLIAAAAAAATTDNDDDDDEDDEYDSEVDNAVRNDNYYELYYDGDYSDCDYDYDN